jgi:hypothetical protein
VTEGRASLLFRSADAQTNVVDGFAGIRRSGFSEDGIRWVHYLLAPYSAALALVSNERATSTAPGGVTNRRRRST